MTRLMLLVALSAVALASLVEALGVMDLLKSNMKHHNSHYSHNPQYAGNGAPGYGYGQQYESAYGAHPAEAYVEPGYGVGAPHNPYGAQYNPYSGASHQSPYGRYGSSHGSNVYQPHGMDYGSVHMPPPMYEPQHHSSHGAGHLYGGMKHGGLSRPHHNGGGSAASSAVAGGGGAAASAAAGGSSVSAAAAGRLGEHHSGHRHPGSKYAHLNHASMHAGPGHLDHHLHAGMEGMHYDGMHRGPHMGHANHLAPAHHSVGLEFELGNPGMGVHHGGEYGAGPAAAASVATVAHNEPEVYHNTELLPDGHKTSTFVDYQEKPVEETMASASGTFSTDDQGIERSSYSRSTEHVQNKEDGHIDDDHYYQAQSYGKTHDDHLHEASNRDDEDYEVTPTGYRKKKRKGNYVKNHTKTTRETGSGVLAKDRHQAGFSKSVNKLVENVNKNKVSHINGVAHDENLSSSQNIDDGDEDFYDSDLSRRGHNIPGPHVPTSSAAAASASSGGSAVTGTGGGASAASSAGPGGVSSSAAAGL